MPLLNKFVTFPKPPNLTKRHAVNSNAHIADIVSNLQVLLQSRRSTDITQNIGLNDFSDLSIDESLMHRLCTDIQQQINLHESRLDFVEVELVENGTTRWLLNVNARLIKTATIDKDLHAPQHINFTLEVAKPAYQAAKREINGVFL